ncbi:MAG: oligosaccharide flippase family protein [Elioraea sp.]|nr:oligosaccharide flippase family protein [Elioraea sp.]
MGEPRAAGATSLRRSVTLAFGYSYVTNAVTFLTSIVLARFFLGPREFGAFSVCMSGYLFLQTLADFGITRFIVQDRTLGEARLRAAFAVLVVGNLAIAAMLLGARNWAAAFFGASEIAAILPVLAAAGLVTPTFGIGNALLTRESRFGALFVAHVGGVVAAAAVGIGTAAAGAGAMALAWLTVTQALVRGGLIVAARPDVLRLRPGFGELRAVLAFGSPVTLVSLYSALLARLPEILIGRLSGLAAAGLYGRAAGLAEQLRWALYTGGATAILPEVARRYHAGESLVGPYLRLTAYVTGLVWPAAGFMGVLALPLIRLVFGPTWVDMAPLLAALSGAVAIFSMIVLYGDVLLLQGRMRAYVAIECTHGTIGLGLFVAGALVGPLAAALSRVLYATIFASAYVVIMRRVVGHSYSEVAAVYGRSLAASAVALLPAVAGETLRLTAGLGDAAAVVPAALLSPLFWYLGLLVARHPLREEVSRVAAAARRRRGS